MRIKNYLFIILFYFLGINVVSATQPDIFVQSTVNRASAILSNDLAKEEKIEKLKEVALETVDIKGIGFYTLGKYRKTLNDNITTDNKEQSGDALTHSPILGWAYDGNPIYGPYGYKLSLIHISEPTRPY